MIDYIENAEVSSPSFPPNKTPRSMIGAFSFVSALAMKSRILWAFALP